MEILQQLLFCKRKMIAPPFFSAHFRRRGKNRSSVKSIEGTIFLKNG